MGYGIEVEVGLEEALCCCCVVVRAVQDCRLRQKNDDRGRSSRVFERLCPNSAFGNESWRKFLAVSRKETSDLQYIDDISKFSRLQMSDFGRLLTYYYSSIMYL